MRDRLAKLWCEAEALRLTNIRASQNRKRGTPGPEGSIAKLMMAELNQRIASFVVNLMGPDGALYDGYTFERPRHALDLSTPVKAFLRARANSIEGGTSEIMRNILGERVLGLPGDRGSTRTTLERRTPQLIRGLNRPPCGTVSTITTPRHRHGGR